MKSCTQTITTVTLMLYRTYMSLKSGENCIQMQRLSAKFEHKLIYNLCTSASYIACYWLHKEESMKGADFYRKIINVGVVWRDTNPRLIIFLKQYVLKCLSPLQWQHTATASFPVLQVICSWQMMSFHSVCTLWDLDIWKICILLL